MRVVLVVISQSEKLEPKICHALLKEIRIQNVVYLERFYIVKGVSKIPTWGGGSEEPIFVNILSIFN